MSHAFSYAAIALGVTSLLLVAREPLARWYHKVRRRRGGVYLWRVDHHRNRARRVNGYVGETVSFYFRSRQHMGVSHYSDADPARRLATAVKVPSQPWSDLNPVMHKVIKLPWWLCWKWVLRPLETLVIFCTWPVYNDAKNRWNPRRIGKGLARAQRNARDGSPWYTSAQTVAAHGLRRALVALTIIVLCFAAYAWAVYS